MDPDVTICLNIFNEGQFCGVTPKLDIKKWQNDTKLSLVDFSKPIYKLEWTEE